METGTFGTHGTLYFSVILHIIRIKAGAWRFVSRVVGNKPSFSCVRTYRSEAVLTKRRIRAIHEKCHFSRPQFTIVASLRCRLRRSFVHWDSSCLYPALRAAGYVPMRPADGFKKCTLVYTFLYRLCEKHKSIWLFPRFSAILLPSPLKSLMGQEEFSHGHFFEISPLP